MAICATCGNDYDRSFTLTLSDGTSYIFDSFECAIRGVAPRCRHCATPIIGHGREVEGVYFCCDHCRRREADSRT